MDQVRFLVRIGRSRNLSQNCIGPTIRIVRESWCLPYAGFFFNCLGFFNCTPNFLHEGERLLFNIFSLFKISKKLHVTQMMVYLFFLKEPPKDIVSVTTEKGFKGYESFVGLSLTKVQKVSSA